MRRVVTAVAWAGLVVACTGCMQLEQTVSLNPDGTGKVDFKTVAPANPMGMMGGAAEKPSDAKALAQQAIRNLLTKSEGVVSWKDVTCKNTDDGKLEVNGTAYFEKLEGLKIGDTRVNAKFEKTETGMALQITENENKAGAGDGDKIGAPELTEEQIQAKIMEEKAKFQQSLPMLGMFLGGLKLSMRFKLPGTLDVVEVFKTMEDGSVDFTLDGEKVLKALNELAKDDAYWRAVALEGRSNTRQGPKLANLNEKIFGVKALPRATVKGDLVPLFDFAGEVEAAKKAFPEMKKTLGIEEGQEAGGDAGAPAVLPVEPAE